MSKSLTDSLIFIGFTMSIIFNQKADTKSKILSNIMFIKTIAIVLGVLIILGLFVLFIGLLNRYENIQKANKNKVVSVSKTEIETRAFDFVQPFEAQLISSSLGAENQILLRYLYKGNNVLVILDAKSNELRSIITIKDKFQNWSK